MIEMLLGALIMLIGIVIGAALSWTIDDKRSTFGRVNTYTPEDKTYNKEKKKAELVLS